MNVKELINCMETEFFSGVPDSQLRALCDYLMESEGISSKHIIAANEGNAVALAAGYHLATGKTPLVYLQNSGIGNIINPVASLLNEEVYAIPCIFIIGWRGEPGIHDEPQHIFQGKITEQLLKDLDISVFTILPNTTISEIKKFVKSGKERIKSGKCIAYLIKKQGLEFDSCSEYQNNYTLTREEVIENITLTAKNDIIVSTTGKASRELFEIREKNKESHKYDFLTVGSMGHTSSIALGIALNKPDKKVWCIDGDGSCLMHMGAMATIGANKPDNFVHIVVDNMAHESVGGMPTVSNNIDFSKVADGCGYEMIFAADTLDEFHKALEQAKNTNKLCFISVKTKIGSRKDLGRPTLSPLENKQAFMEYLGEKIN